MNFISLSAPESAQLRAEGRVQIKQKMEPQPVLVDNRTYTWPEDGPNSHASWTAQCHKFTLPCPYFWTPWQVGVRYAVKEPYWQDRREDISIIYAATANWGRSKFSDKPEQFKDDTEQRFIKYFSHEEILAQIDGHKWWDLHEADTMPDWAVRSWATCSAISVQQEDSVWYWVVDLERSEGA